MEVRFEILGDPVGKGRPKFTTVSGFAKAYTPKKTENYETCVRNAYGDYYFGNEELVVEITAYFQLQKTHYTKKGINASGMKKLNGEINPTTKPDTDNIAKIILDALNGIAYHDDSQVVDLRVCKRYAEQPKVVVRITDEV